MYCTVQKIKPTFCNNCKWNIKFVNIFKKHNSQKKKKNNTTLWKHWRVTWNRFGREWTSERNVTGRVSYLGGFSRQNLHKNLWSSLFKELKDKVWGYYGSWKLKGYIQEKRKPQRGESNCVYNFFRKLWLTHEQYPQEANPQKPI